MILKYNEIINNIYSKYINDINNSIFSNIYNIIKNESNTISNGLDINKIIAFKLIHNKKSE